MIENSTMRNNLNLNLVFGLFFIGLVFISCDAEEGSQDAEVPQTDLNIAKASMDEIEMGIKKHIQEKSDQDGGLFKIKDDSLDLELELVRVHTEYLSNLGPGSYFACVDLADTEGDVYDVDFFLEGNPGNMIVTKTSVHKLNGKPFYSWKQNKQDKTWKKIPLEQSDNRLFGVVEGEDAFEFFYEVQLPKIEQKAQVWIPMAQTDLFQQIEITKMDLPAIENYAVEEQFNNKILFMELEPQHSKKKISIHYKVTRKEKQAYNDDEREVERYLTSNAMVPVNEKFRSLAEKAIKKTDTSSTLMQARAIYDYIIDNMNYIKKGYYGKGDAVYACDSKSGNCSEFHSLFIAMTRSIGIPSRFAIGASIPADRDEGGIDGYHCWAEFYAEGKWWPVDISEGNKYTALATYYFGHHGANRIELSRGRDLVPDPLPHSGPINFLAYPLMEEDGKTVFPETSFGFKR